MGPKKSQQQGLFTAQPKQKANSVKAKYRGKRMSPGKKDESRGWMETATFANFIDHFDKFAGQDRLVELLFDSVSSHVNHDVFMQAKSKGI